MLREHLSQAHDAASRRVEIIDKQVAWIHAAVLSGRPTRLVDLGCGPGLYTSRLAKLGHDCIGLDFSPASNAYANERNRVDQTRCIYLRQDIRMAD
ncbi:MAG: class I SAM-dependent methyltransferase [Chloroflexi bacterium]|nr:class I SAM-dependent methyltransferase [Chloroflexota bacterium]